MITGPHGLLGLPEVGTRVSVRFRRPAGSVPPLTDVVGHLLGIDPQVRVRTKAGATVEFAPDDVVTVRSLTDVPLRTSQIRALEHAAALAWPGVEWQWLDGWLLRAGHGSPLRGNSAVPLDFSSTATTISAIIDWYADRSRAPWLAIPERMLTVAAAARVETRVIPHATQEPPSAPGVTLAARPDDAWLACYARDVPVDVLTAVAGGEVVFASRGDAAVGRAAVTDAPDGWAYPMCTWPPNSAGMAMHRHCVQRR